MERPTKSETNKAIIGATPPTAARAALSIKRPATTESAVLNSCWKILVSASGIAKRITREGIGPLSISMLFFFFIGASLLICAIPSSCVSLDLLYSIEQCEFSTLESVHARLSFYRHRVYKLKVNVYLSSTVSNCLAGAQTHASKAHKALVLYPGRFAFFV